MGVGYEQAIMGVEERICFMENRIEFNAAKYPKVMSLVIGKSINADKVDTDMNSMEPELAIYLPRGVYLIYLQDMVNKRKHTEIELFKKYAYGVVLEDKDYSALLHLDYASMRMKIKVEAWVGIRKFYRFISGKRMPVWNCHIQIVISQRIKVTFRQPGS